MVSADEYNTLYRQDLMQSGNARSRHRCTTLPQPRTSPRASPVASVPIITAVVAAEVATAVVDRTLAEVAAADTAEAVEVGRQVTGVLKDGAEWCSLTLCADGYRPRDMAAVWAAGERRAVWEATGWVAGVAVGADMGQAEM